jgi:hypothetical protein
MIYDKRCDQENNVGGSLPKIYHLLFVLWWGLGRGSLVGSGFIGRLVPAVNAGLPIARQAQGLVPLAGMSSIVNHLISDTVLTR